MGATPADVLRVIPSSREPTQVPERLRSSGTRSEAHLVGQGVGHPVRHAELAQAEGGGQVGGEEARPQRDGLVRVQVPARPPPPAPHPWAPRDEHPRGQDPQPTSRSGRASLAPRRLTMKACAQAGCVSLLTTQSDRSFGRCPSFSLQKRNINQKI